MESEKESAEERSRRLHQERHARYAHSERGRAQHREYMRRIRKNLREEYGRLAEGLRGLGQVIRCEGCRCLEIYGKPCSFCWKKIYDTVLAMEDRE